MSGRRFELSAGAALLGALLVFLLRGEELAALALPVAAHELGHLGALLSLGLRPRCFRVEIKGLCLDYAGDPGVMGQVWIAAAGPAAGLLYAWAAARLGTELGWDWLCLSAGISLLLSLFNLLPALPLDGGQILFQLSLAALGERRAAAVTRAAQLLTAAALSAVGLLLLVQRRGAAQLFAGLALFFDGLSGPGLVKKGKIR